MATLDLVSAGETNWATRQNANLTALNTELIATTAKANAALTALLSLCAVTPRAATSGTWTDTLGSQSPFAAYATNGGTNGDYLAWDVALLPGTYKVSLGYRARTDGGIVSVQLDGTEIATFDTYAGSAANRHITRSDIDLTGYATRRLTLALSGKHALSTGYFAQIGGINLVRVSD